MRRLLVLAAMAWPLLCGLGPGIQDDASPNTALEPDWLVEPSFSDLVKSYPATALEKGLGGHTAITCDLETDGRLSHCVLSREDPVDAGFGAASLSLADKFRMKPEAVKTHLAKAPRITIPIHWAMITHPEWISRPNGKDLTSNFPQQALMSGVGGKSVMECRVTDAGELSDCVVMSETPIGFGFGAAILKLAKRFRMRPETVDGKAVSGALVVIPINWIVEGRPQVFGGQMGIVLTVIDQSKKETWGIQSVACPTEADGHRRCGVHPISWEKSPSPAELAQILDKYKLHRGVTQMVCKVNESGALVDCKALGKVSAEEEAAMRELAERSKVQLITSDKVSVKDGAVTLLFNWEELREELNLAHYPHG